MSFILNTVRDRAILGKFWTLRVLSSTPLVPMKNLDSILNFGGNGEYRLS